MKNVIISGNNNPKSSDPSKTTIQNSLENTIEYFQQLNSKNNHIYSKI